MKIFYGTIWVIMSKDRKYIAKGTPRNRELVAVDNEKDKKRFLTYLSKAKAEAGFSRSGFYGPRISENDLEAVEVEVKMHTK